ncbi:MAG: ATP-binding protein [Pseudomonadales bacterium]
MSKEVTIKVGGTPDELEKVNAAIDDLAESEGWPSDLAFQVTLVMEELEMNIMQHAYGGDGSAQSQVTFKSEPDKLTIEVIDGGKAFNPLEEAEAPDTDAALEDREMGGLGVHLVRTMMDELDYRREDDKNHLTLVKFRKA